LPDTTPDARSPAGGPPNHPENRIDEDFIAAVLAREGTGATASSDQAGGTSVTPSGRIIVRPPPGR
jgi:hypothetical protein